MFIQRQNYFINLCTKSWLIRKAKYLSTIQYVQYKFNGRYQTPGAQGLLHQYEQLDFLLQESNFWPCDTAMDCAKLIEMWITEDIQKTIRSSQVCFTEGAGNRKDGQVKRNRNIQQSCIPVPHQTPQDHQNLNHTIAIIAANESVPSRTMLSGYCMLEKGPHL